MTYRVYSVIHHCGELSLKTHLEGTKHECNEWVKRQPVDNFIVTKLSYTMAAEEYL